MFWTVVSLVVGPPSVPATIFGREAPITVPDMRWVDVDLKFEKRAVRREDWGDIRRVIRCLQHSDRLDQAPCASDMSRAVLGQDSFTVGKGVVAFAVGGDEVTRRRGGLGRRDAVRKQAR